MKTDLNQEKNKIFYENLYKNYPIKNILHWINNLDDFLDSATKTETSWFGLYIDNFKENLKGKKVLEMGCGNCTNAAVMAALGAEVYANDIASSSGDIISRLNENYHFDYPIIFVDGDFLHNQFKNESFDFIIGKAFLHHLTLPTEKLFLAETARLLKKNGEARFFEPAVNDKILDWLRWYIPVPGRPSKLNRNKFAEWKNEDPHPDRSFSSAHWTYTGKIFFEEVRIIPIGILERFGRIIKRGRKREEFRKWALKAENMLPTFLKRRWARSQVIIYKRPISLYHD